MCRRPEPARLADTSDAGRDQHQQIRRQSKKEKKRERERLYMLTHITTLEPKKISPKLWIVFRFMYKILTAMSCGQGLPEGVPALPNTQLCLPVSLNTYKTVGSTDWHQVQLIFLYEGKSLK